MEYVGPKYPKRASTVVLRMMCDPDNDYVWRVHIDSEDQVVAKYIGYIRIDTERTLNYKSIHDAPDWIQNGVAILRMFPADVDRSLVKGVGRRVEDDVFWVVQPMETIV